jgi:hypothetical protein
MDEDDRLIDAALSSYPLSPVPPGFTRRVMREVGKFQVRRLKVETNTVRFRLDFLDVALPAFFAFFGMLGFMALLGALLLLDAPHWMLIQSRILQAQFELQLLLQGLQYSGGWQLVFPAWLWLAFAAAGICVLVLGVVIAFFWMHPSSPKIA